MKQVNVAANQSIPMERLRFPEGLPKAAWMRSSLGRAVFGACPMTQSTVQDSSH